MNKKQNRKRQAGTADDSNSKADVTTSSQPIANTFVVSRFASDRNMAKHEKTLQVMSGNSCLELQKPITEFCPPEGYKYAANNFDFIIEKMIDDFKSELKSKVSKFFMQENFEKKVVIVLESHVSLVSGQ